MAELSNVVKNEVGKKIECNKLVTKVDSIDTTGFLLKAKYHADNLEIEKTMKELAIKVTKQGGLATRNEVAAVENKMPDVTGLVRKTDYNSKIIEIESKIPSISGLATSSALTAV